MDESIPRLQAALEGRYRIERELGTGGMSTVYLAADLRHDREVALKVLRPELAAVVAGTRFLGEIKTTARLQHPHILPLLDSGEAGGFLYYAMPFVEGESLRQRLDREGELPVDEALKIANDLAEALDYAHRRGVVHRDIKPANVLMHDGQAVISDFGIALAVDHAGGARITGTGQSVGTPYYMSPEQANPSSEVDGRSDIYSLGCMLHEMLAGEPVFTGPTPRIVLAKHLTAPPIPVRSLRSTVPKGVERAVLKALEKSPADRFASMAEFVEALRSGAHPGPSVRAVREATTDWVRAHPFGTTAAALAIVGTAVVAAPFLSGPAWTDRPASIAVLPFRTAASSDAEAALAVEIADDISRELQRWEGMSVATDIDLAGPRRELGLDEPTLEQIGDGTALADLVDAEAMLAVTVRQVGDEMALQASLFDSRSRRRVGPSITPTGPQDEAARARLIAPILAGVLGFGDAPEPARALGAGTGNPDAAVAYLRGRDALERNQLDEAEALFTGAIERDSTFATALSFLGQTHFWRGSEAGVFFSLGPQISRWGTAATRHLDGLSPQNRDHVLGFYALQLGDFGDARARYGSALEADGSDAYALLMLGELDLLDRWSVRDATGSLVPRSNLNRAWRAFSTVVRIEPTYELAYGRIFAIQRALEGPVDRDTSCPGFEELGDVLRPIWQRPVPGPGMYPLCPVALDSIEWMPWSQFETADRLVLRAGANRFFDRAVGELTRWANFAPDQPRPLELLSEAYVLRRYQSAITPPARHKALAAEALQYQVRALGLQADTAALDLVELANLELAAGDLTSAMETALLALDRYADDGRAAPTALLNVLLVGGRTQAALEIVDSLPPGGGMSRYVPDPETGELVAVAAGGRIIQRLRVLAASGVSGSSARREIQRLTDAWAAEGYPPEWQQLLRDHNTPAIAPNLALDSVELARWRDAVASDDSAWIALSLADVEPEQASLVLDRIRGSGMERYGSSGTFTMAATAGKLGRHTDAVALYSRLDSVPLAIGFFDVGWGLQALSHFMRAEHYGQLGDQTSAAEHYRSFIETRSWADSLAGDLVEEARDRLDRIGTS